MKYHSSGETLPAPISHRSVADTWEAIRGYTTPISIGIHSYLPDGRPLYAAYATEFESGSFKERGALEKMLLLGSAGVDRAVLYSAGNHLTGCSLAARETGIHIDGIVPGYTPQLKMDRALELGNGNVTVRQLSGGLDKARDAAYAMATQLGAPVIEPYDDEDVARGQGTLMHELLLRMPEIDHVVVPEGGGGLRAGVATAVRELGLTTKVHGAKLSAEYELCEGAYVHQLGQVALQTSRENSRLWGTTLRVTSVDVGAMVALEDAARLEHAEAMGSAALEGYPEGTALLGAAAVHAYYEQFEGTVAVIVTGSNADQKKLDTLHDRYKSSLQVSTSAGFHTASGHQFRRQAA